MPLQQRIGILLGAEQLSFLVQRRHLHPRTPSQLIDGAMGGHLAQPKAQVPVRLDGSQAAVHLHEYFLRQAFRKIPRTQHAQRQAVDGALVRLD
jgi:hypothetical protein